MIACRRAAPMFSCRASSAPLVNELVIGLPKRPVQRGRADAGFGAGGLRHQSDASRPFSTPVPRPVNQTLGTNITNLAPSNLPRKDLVAAFLTGIPREQASVGHRSEMMRLNTGIAPTPRPQSTFGVVGNDLAGFPNGRRPGDDTVDIALRVVMGRLCYPCRSTARRQISACANRPMLRSAW